MPGETCPRCEKRRVGAFRFCLSCGFDYDSRPTFWGTPTDESESDAVTEPAAAAVAVAEPEPVAAPVAVAERPIEPVHEPAPTPVEPSVFVVSEGPYVTEGPFIDDAAIGPPAVQRRDSGLVAVGVAAILLAAAVIGLFRGPTPGIRASDASSPPSPALTLPAAGGPSPSPSESLDTTPSESPAAAGSQGISPSASGPIGPTDSAAVVKVIDGTTIEVLVGHGAKIVRYLSITVPGALPDPGAAQARDLNDALVRGKQVFLERDVTDVDQNGRLLRHVWVVGPDGQPLLVGERIVRQGLAIVTASGPDLKYVDLYYAAQDAAKADLLGRWASPSP